MICKDILFAQGFHYHLRRALDGWVMSPQVANAIIMEFVTQWNLTAEHNHMGKPHWGITCVEVLDVLRVSHVVDPTPIRVPCLWCSVHGSINWRYLSKPSVYGLGVVA